jgi:hypothetical protein
MIRVLGVVGVVKPGQEFRVSYNLSRSLEDDYIVSTL